MNDKLRADLEQVLIDCSEYFADRADADCEGDPLEFVPNAEMRLQTQVDDVLARLEKEPKS
jgi:hypothetical protein